MAPASLLVGEFRSQSMSHVIPEKLAQTYQQLEDLAFAAFSKDSNKWSVHFHLQDDECEGNLLPFVWNDGGYFDESNSNAAKLHIYAHFQSKTASNTGRYSYGTRKDHNETSTIVRTTRSSAVSPGQTKIAPVSCKDGLPIAVSEPPVREVERKTMTPRKRARVQDLSSPSTSQLSMASDLGPYDSEREFDDHLDDIPSLSANALEQYDVDLEAFKNANASYRHYGHSRIWDTISQAARTALAHARLIYGSYGVPAPVPCGFCREKRLVCRVYHPNIISQKDVTTACGECRARRKGCDLRANPGKETYNKSGDVVVTRGKVTPQALEQQKNVPQAVEVSSRSDTATVVCPVIGCTVRSLGIADLNKHLRQSHPASVHTRKLRPSAGRPAYSRAALNAVYMFGGRGFVRNKSVGRVSKGISTPRKARTYYFCPVADCENASHGYSQLSNLQRHFACKHPKKSLNSFKNGETYFTTKVQSASRVVAIPRAPSVEKFETHYREAMESNAKPDEYGHRPDEIWNTLGRHTHYKIAAARLIHGQYGAPVPKPCTRCREQKLECRVYHPDFVTQASRYLGHHCGPCRLKKLSTCDVGANPFEGYTLLRESSDKDKAGSASMQSGALKVAGGKTFQNTMAGNTPGRRHFGLRMEISDSEEAAGSPNSDEQEDGKGYSEETGQHGEGLPDKGAGRYEHNSVDDQDSPNGQQSLSMLGNPGAYIIDFGSTPPSSPRSEEGMDAVDTTETVPVPFAVSKHPEVFGGGKNMVINHPAHLILNKQQQEAGGKLLAPTGSATMRLGHSATPTKPSDATENFERQYRFVSYSREPHPSKHALTSEEHSSVRSYSTPKQDGVPPEGGKESQSPCMGRERARIGRTPSSKNKGKNDVKDLSEDEKDPDYFPTQREGALFGRSPRSNNKLKKSAYVHPLSDDE